MTEGVLQPWQLEDKCSSQTSAQVGWHFFLSMCFEFLALFANIFTKLQSKYRLRFGFILFLVHFPLKIAELFCGKAVHGSPNEST